jgi:hypothetical protein
MISQKQIDIIYEMGVYFGYPRCCINAYIHDRVNETSPRKRNIHGNMTGFTPCQTHVNLINNGELKLEELIQSRICKEGFPNHNKHDLQYP